jgi:hypothetical protein
MKAWWLVVLALIPRLAMAGDLVSVPWEEIKALYQEKAERKAMENMKTDAVKKA